MTRPGKSRAPAPELKAAARAAGLRYSLDAGPGWRRARSGRGFKYLDERGHAIRSPGRLARIRALAIPPAWTDVWICPQENGHLQATGRDGRGRKQYRYHDGWRQVRDDAKYRRLVLFGESLPKIRSRVRRDLAQRGLPRSKVLATVVRLLETTLIRVGNDEYASSNNSFGLTTLKDRHVKIKGRRMLFTFRGKGGIAHDIDVCNQRLAKIVRDCQSLPGRELLQYVDDAGQVRDIGSSDVNEYLREISGQEFTAKDFRTWAGTALAAAALREVADFDSDAAAKQNITQAIERVACRLGNTKTICRKSYVHPGVIEAYLDRSLIDVVANDAARELRGPLKRLPAEEAVVLTLLRQRMKRELRRRGPRRPGRSRRKIA